MWNPEKIWHKNLTDWPPPLSDVATVPREIEKKSFSTVLFIHTSNYLHYLTKTISNPLFHPTWKYLHTNLWIAKLFHLTEGFLRSFRRWRLWKEPVVGCRRWLWSIWIIMLKNDFFGFLKVQWLHVTGEADKSVSCSCEIFSGLYVPKIIKIGQFLTELLKKIKRWTFFGDTVVYYCSQLMYDERNSTHPRQSVYSATCSASQTSRNRTSNRQTAKRLTFQTFPPESPPGRLARRLKGITTSRPG